MFYVQAEKSFVCEYCSRTFAREAQLTDHISTVHHGAVEHRCDQCGKMLGSALTLRIHQRQLHEHKCQQTCDGCGRQFTRLDSLINHLTSTHPHLLPDKYRRRLNELVCKECGLNLTSRHSLQCHLEARHGGAPKYRCPLCSRRFSCQRYVRRHLRGHHAGAANAIAATASMKTTLVEDIADEDSKSVSDVLWPPAINCSIL